MKMVNHIVVAVNVVSMIVMNPIGGTGNKELHRSTQDNAVSVVILNV